jgi:hypothetical protein
MSNATLTETLSPQEVDRDLLDGLIAQVQNTHDPNSALLSEHLQSARTYLLGAMPLEYSHNLELAKNTARSLSNRELRDQLQWTIAALERDLVQSLDSRVPLKADTQPARARSHPETDLSQFFKDSNTSFGVFYPKNYSLLVFPSFGDAAAAGATLLDSGIRDQEIVVASGDEVVRFFSHSSPLGEVMTRVSRFFETEQTFVDDYIARAREGAGFIGVCTPNEHTAERVRDLVLPFGPKVMRWYRTGGIQSVI